MYTEKESNIIQGLKKTLKRLDEPLGAHAEKEFEMTSCTTSIKTNICDAPLIVDTNFSISLDDLRKDIIGIENSKFIPDCMLSKFVKYKLTSRLREVEDYTRLNVEIDILEYEKSGSTEYPEIPVLPEITTHVQGCTQFILASMIHLFAGENLSVGITFRVPELEVVTRGINV